MPFSHAEAWIAQNPKRFYAILVVVAVMVWTGQTYVWNPFWTFGYEYYPISMFFIAGGLGFLLPKRKRPGKQALDHIVQEIKATPPLTAYSPRIGSYFCINGHIIYSELKGTFALTCPVCHQTSSYDSDDARPISNSESDRSRETPVAEPIESNPFLPPPLESLRDDDEV